MAKLHQNNKHSISKTLRWKLHKHTTAVFEAASGRSEGSGNGGRVKELRFGFRSGGSQLSSRQDMGLTTLRLWLCE